MARNLLSVVDFRLGDPQQDADQESFFDALEDYLDGFDGPDRKMHAIHNMLMKLKLMANEQHVAKGREA